MIKSCLLGVLMAAFFIAGVWAGTHTPGPGAAPTDVFLDANEWYSSDGCWVLRQGYWRPLTRCHIVRVPSDPQLIKDVQ